MQIFFLILLRHSGMNSMVHLAVLLVFTYRTDINGLQKMFHSTCLLVFMWSVVQSITECNKVDKINQSGDMQTG